MGIGDQLLKAFRAGAQAFGEGEDGSVPDEDVSPEELHKAMVAQGLAEPTEEKPRGLFHDPYAVLDWGGWRERPSSLTYDTLREMSIKMTPIAAIILLRVNQLSQFARPQQGRYDRGFRVGLRDRRDSKRTMSPEEAKQAAEIERMLEHTGYLLPDERPSDRDDFKTFLKKWIRDQLTYDQFAAEIMRDKRGRISRFVALPSETIRPASVDTEHQDVSQMRENVSHVQIYENTVIADWDPDSIIWSVMNPRSDLRVNGFGFSPLEQLINLVTAWLYGFDFNRKFFSNGSTIKGIVNIKGAIPDRQLRAFRRMWYSMVSGINNAWKTPILNSEDVQFLNMHANNKDMEFAAWMDWLTKLTAAVYQVDPIEINFQFGNTGQKSAISEGSQEYKIIESKDKGLRPLADHIADTLNRQIIWEINPDFEFMFAGLDAKAEENEREGDLKEVKGFRTVNEIRAARDLDPLPDGKGDVILDPNYIQWASAQGQGAEGGGSGFDEFGDGEDEGDDDGSDDGSVFATMPGSEEDQDDIAAKSLRKSRRARVTSQRRGDRVKMIVDL